MKINLPVSLCYLTLSLSLVGCSGSSPTASATPSATASVAATPTPPPGAPPKWSVPQSQSALSFSPDGKVLLTASGKGVTGWRVSSGKKIKTLASSDSNFPIGAWSPDGTTVLTGGTTGFHTWDWESEEQKEVEINNVSSLKGAAFLPHDRILLRTVEGIQTQKMDDSDHVSYRGNVTAFCNELFATTDPFGEGKIVVTLRETDKLTIKNSLTWQDQPGNGRCIALALSDGGKWLAAATSQKRVWIFDTSKKSPETRFSINESNPSSLAISPDGKYVVTGGKGRKIEMWSVASGSPIYTADANGEVNAVAISPDGKHAAAVANDETVYLWPLPDSSK